MAASPRIDNSQPDAPPDFETLIYAEDDDTARITFNRPEVMNALSIAASDDLVSAVDHIRRSRQIKIVVLNGAGGNFCTGDDLKEMTSWGNADDFMHRVRYYQNMANQLEELDKITIASVDGYAVGGGLEVTMACDFVIAAERAKWGMPEIDWGITPGWGGTTRMSRLIGRRLTKEINYLGAIHGARRAVDVGLWNRVVADDELDAETERLVELLRTKHHQGLRQMKYIINRGVEADLYTAQGFEAMSSLGVAAVNGFWEIDDADKGQGWAAFRDKDGLHHTRRDAARDFWVD